jgi:hypothetical protein
LWEITWCGNRNIFALEILSEKFLQRNCTDSCLRVVALERCVRNERADIFFELGQERHNIRLREDETFVIVHLGCNGEVELGALKHLDHHLYMLLHLAEHASSGLSLSISI